MMLLEATQNSMMLDMKKESSVPAVCVYGLGKFWIGGSIEDETKDSLQTHRVQFFSPCIR